MKVAIKMNPNDLTTNASTDDLLSLGSLPGPSDDQFPANGTPSQNTTPHETPPSTPGTLRKSHPALRLNVDGSTWTKERAYKKKSPSTIKNVQAKAAKVMAVVQTTKTPEFRFRIVLAFLLLSIVTIVILTWHLHQAHLEALRLSVRADFNSGPRLLQLLDDSGRVLLQGKLGYNIPPALEPHACPLEQPGFCQEWKYRARLEIVKHTRDEAVCYSVLWQAVSSHTELLDCYDLSGAYWYGMGEVENLTWPLSELHIPLTPFETGEVQPLGSVVKPYWLSSRGVSILADSEQSILLFSFNHSSNNQLCLASSPGSEGLPTLNYTLCTGPNILTVHKATLPPVNESTENLTVFLESPVLVPRPGEDGNLTQQTVHEYANTFVNHGFNGGFVLIENKWQRHQGDLTFWKQTFQQPAEIIKILQNKGNKVLLDVHPYICLNSDNLEIAMNSELLLSDPNKVPLLTKWNESLCAVLDLFKKQAAEWFLKKLDNLKTQYGVDGFVFRGGQARTLPFGQGRWSTSFLSKYLKVAKQSSPYLGTPGGAGFITLAPQPSSWDALRSILPKVLTLGLLGYKVISPGCVGGDLVPSGTKPDRELYSRWSQLAVFMPVLQFSVLPSDYNDDFELTKVSRILTNFRKDRVIPAILTALKEDAPIVRPLWWLDPHDPNTYAVGYQFAVGNDLIVAPILDPGKNSTYVYLPHGWWCEDQKSHRGKKWINVPAPLDKVAYFVRSEKCKS